MTDSSWFEAEIREQPKSLGRLLTTGRAIAEQIAARIVDYGPQFAVIAARGSSDNAARYAQYLFGIRHELSVALAAPSILTHHGARPRMAGALVIGISQSGVSPDVVKVVNDARSQGALTLAVVNETASSLAQAAELVMPIHAGQERSVAATKTYTGQLTALAMLSSAWRNDASSFRQLEELPEFAERALENSSAASAMAGTLRQADRYVVVGRGYNYATAFEAALKLKETCYVAAEPYSSADFLHGPIAILDSHMLLMAVAPSGRGSEGMTDLLERARSQKSRTIVISDQPQRLEHADLGLRLPKDVPEWLSPIAAVVPAQLWAEALSAERGTLPDKPRGLSKVTETW